VSAVERLSKITLDGRSLSLEDVLKVAREHWPVAPIEPGSDVYAHVEERRTWVDGGAIPNAPARHRVS
jgi:hypothetical protein